MASLLPNLAHYSKSKSMLEHGTSGMTQSAGFMEMDLVAHCGVPYMVDPEGPAALDLLNAIETRS